MFRFLGALFLLIMLYNGVVITGNIAKRTKNNRYMKCYTDYTHKKKH